MPPLGLGFKGQTPPKSQIASPLDDYESARSYQSDQSYDDSRVQDLGPRDESSYRLYRQRQTYEREYRNIPDYDQPMNGRQPMNFHGQQMTLEQPPIQQQQQHQYQQYYEPNLVQIPRIGSNRYDQPKSNDYDYLSNPESDRYYDRPHRIPESDNQPINRIYSNEPPPSRQLQQHKQPYAYQPSDDYDNRQTYYGKDRSGIYDVQYDDQPHPHHRAVGHPSSYQEVSDEEEEAYRRKWEQSVKQRMEKDRYQLPPLELDNPKQTHKKPTSKPLHLSGSVEYDRIIQQFHNDAGNYGGVEGFFDEIDFNRDGVITLEEFRNYLRFHEVIVDR